EEVRVYMSAGVNLIQIRESRQQEGLASTPE
ncbi:uncharacterized, partial [Tachysurus ichikawai]